MSKFKARESHEGQVADWHEGVSKQTVIESFMENYQMTREEALGLYKTLTDGYPYT